MRNCPAQASFKPVVLSPAHEKMLLSREPQHPTEPRVGRCARGLRKPTAPIFTTKGNWEDRCGELRHLGILISPNSHWPRSTRDSEGCYQPRDNNSWGSPLLDTENRCVREDMQLSSLCVTGGSAVECTPARTPSEPDVLGPPGTQTILTLADGTAQAQQEPPLLWHRLLTGINPLPRIRAKQVTVSRRLTFSSNEKGTEVVDSQVPFALHVPSGEKEKQRFKELSSSTHPFIGSNAALSQPQPESRVRMVHLNSFNQTLKGSERPSDVQQLDPTVI